MRRILILLVLTCIRPVFAELNCSSSFLGTLFSDVGFFAPTPFRVQTPQWINLENASDWNQKLQSGTQKVPLYFRVLKDISFDSNIQPKLRSLNNVYIDGLGNALKGINVTQKEDGPFGLFSEFDNSLLVNIRIQGATLVKQSNKGDFGLVSGRMEHSVICNLHVTQSTLSDSSVGSKNSIGAISGIANKVLVSTSSVDSNSLIRARENATMGSLFGAGSAIIKLARSSASLSSFKNSPIETAGGLIGGAGNCLILQSSFSGSLQLNTTHLPVGGLVGYAQVQDRFLIKDSSQDALFHLAGHYGGLVGTLDCRNAKDCLLEDSVASPRNLSIERGDFKKQDFVASFLGNPHKVQKANRNLTMEKWRSSQQVSQSVLYEENFDFLVNLSKSLPDAFRANHALVSEYPKKLLPQIISKKGIGKMPLSHQIGYTSVRPSPWIDLSSHSKSFGFCPTATTTEDYFVRKTTGYQLEFAFSKGLPGEIWPNELAYEAEKRIDFILRAQASAELNHLYGGVRISAILRHQPSRWENGLPTEIVIRIEAANHERRNNEPEWLINGQNRPFEQSILIEDTKRKTHLIGIYPVDTVDGKMLLSLVLDGKPLNEDESPIEVSSVGFRIPQKGLPCFDSTKGVYLTRFSIFGF